MMAQELGRRDRQTPGVGQTMFRALVVSSGSPYPSGMPEISVTDDELSLLRNAVKAFLGDFSHDQKDVLVRLRALQAKLAAVK